jgi:hypothetical protein
MHTRVCARPCHVQVLASAAEREAIAPFVKLFQSLTR